MRYEQELSGLFRDEGFKAEIAGLTTVEDLQAAFVRHGVEMTAAEVAELCGTIAQHVGIHSGELGEEALENVSGGIAGWLIVLGIGCVGAFALGAWNGYNDAKNGK